MQFDYPKPSDIENAGLMDGGDGGLSAYKSEFDEGAFDINKYIEGA